MEMYYASPAESRLPVAPLVKCVGKLRTTLQSLLDDPRTALQSQEGIR